MDDASLKPSGGLKHLKYLDSLRGIAILMVILVHSWIASGYVIPFFLIGQRGVQLFFIVSALTLMMSLHTRQEPRRWSSYFVRRFFRIAPMFYLALVGNLILTASRGSQFNAGEVLLGFTMMHGFSPELINHIVIGGWSIAVEVLFYLVLPLIFRWVKTLMASAVLLAVAASVCGFVSWPAFIPAQPSTLGSCGLSLSFPCFVRAFSCILQSRASRSRICNSARKRFSRSF